MPPTTTSSDRTRATGQFRHEALLYSGARQFAEDTAAFTREALSAGEAVMVAVIEPRAGLLRRELGADAREVRFIDMERVGRNPARIIPAWQDWVDEQTAAGRAFRGIGEPVWVGRGVAEIVECHLHEDLLNTAFDLGPAWRLLCPYDTSSLDRTDIERAHRTHPVVRDRVAGRRDSLVPHEDPQRDAAFGNAASVNAALDDTAVSDAAFTVALPEPAGALLAETAFTVDDLYRLRRLIEGHAGAAGLDAHGVEGLLLAVNELTTNSVVHGGGSGRLRLWLDAREMICEIRDRGLIDDPLVGRVRPRGAARGGAGLWIANQICDLVRIRSVPGIGTTVRVHVGLDARA